MIAEVVEKVIPKSYIKRDLFNFIDLIAVDGENGSGCIGVQTTSSSNVWARVYKATANSELVIWLKAGNRFVVHGWSQRTPKAAKRGIHVLHLVEVRLKDLQGGRLELFTRGSNSAEGDTEEVD
jgi:hypothetical protein